MWHTWERREKSTRFWWGSQKERDHSEDQDIDGRMGRMNLREIGWGRVDQDRGWWRDVVSAVMNL
jgi:hypothetical protein